MKIAFMFSGQGSQAVGMGKRLYDDFEQARNIFKRASNTLGYDTTEICFNKNDLINETQYSQPLLLTVSLAAYEVLSKKMKCDVMMGLSLGEYSALTAAGAFAFEDAVKLVQRRGMLMSAVAGGMTAVMGLNIDTVTEICSKNLGVFVANYNTSDQIVIGGDLGVLPSCEAMIKAAGGKFVRLKVSGPFHTPLLAEASKEFNKELDKIHTAKFNTPIITNVTGSFLQENFTDSMKIHMTSQVKWVDSVLTAIEFGVDTFIELGAGKTLCSFVKKIAGDSVMVYKAEELIWEKPL